MRENYKQDFPTWVNDTEVEYDLCLTDDIDSLLSCAILNKIKGYKINLFYDFNGLYTLEDTGNQAIGVDMDITKGKAWGNHVVKLSPHDACNSEIANLNVAGNISRKNYTSKFCGSTLLTIMSYYGVTIDNLSEEGKMILLAIDGGYSPFFNNRFKETGTAWLVNVLEYPELKEVIDRHSKQDFERMIRQYGLWKPIRMVDGKLETEIDLEGISQALNGLEIEMPSGEFTQRAGFNNVTKDLSHDQSCYLTKSHIGEMFSMAVTYRNSICCSI